MTTLAYPSLSPSKLYSLNLQLDLLKKIFLAKNENEETIGNQQLHQSVLLTEVIENLDIKPDGIYVDATFGRGGYSSAILSADASVNVIAIDRDPEAQLYATQLSQKYGSRFQFITGCFSQLTELLPSYYQKISGLVFDLGVSSPQLDQAERGFSFRFDGPLDMRMSNQGITAADIISTYSDSELLKIIRTYGEENYARQIVKAIVVARTENPITTTLQLAAIIEKVVPRFLQKIHPATRTFQALRIVVNDELKELESGLAASLKLLCNKGRLVAVSFHSLEDRIVKQFIQNHSVMPAVNRFSPDVNKTNMDFKKVTKKAVVASQAEVKINARSRSAKLRSAIRVIHGEDYHE